MRVELLARRDGQTVEIALHGVGFSAEVMDETHARLAQVAAARGGGQVRLDLKAPMPGLVVKVLVEPGQEVTPGEPLVVLQAMKMENELSLPRGGKVSQVGVTEGQTVRPARCWPRSSNAALGHSCAHARLCLSIAALAGRFAARGPAPFTPAPVEGLRHSSNESGPCFCCGAYAHLDLAPLPGPGGRRLTPRPRSGGSPREGARSELASGAATGGGGPQAPPTPDKFEHETLEQARTPYTSRH